MPQPPVLHGPYPSFKSEFRTSDPSEDVFFWPGLWLSLSSKWLKVIVWCRGIRPLAVKLRCKIFSVSPCVRMSVGELHLEGEDVCDADCEGVRHREILM